VTPPCVPELRSLQGYVGSTDGVNGGLLGITDLLLRAHVMSTYLSHDWGRDWGSLRKFETIADAHPAQLDLGTAIRSGWWSPGQIRIKA